MRQAAIIIACLASFRVLFTRQEAAARPQAITYSDRPKGTSFHHGLLRSLDLRIWRSTRSRFQDDTSESYDLTAQPNQQARCGARPQTGNSREQIIPSQDIYGENVFKPTLFPRGVETGPRKEQWADFGGFNGFRM